MTNETLNKPINLQGLSLAAAMIKNEIDRNAMHIYICDEGDYDPDTFMPTVAGDPQYLYLVPICLGEEYYTYTGETYVGDKIGSNTVTSADVDTWYQKMWIYEAGDGWISIDDFPAKNADIENMLDSIGLSSINLSSDNSGGEG